jgi:Cys-rich four helix bundle protein (predicted Tat secretion target)
MNRRELFTAVGAATLVAAAVPAMAANHDSHAHHGAGPNAKLIETSVHCVMTGNVCLQHCFTTFAAGDTSLARCAVQVNELAAVCTALQEIAAGNSAHLKAMSKVVMAVCQDCEKECRKHEAKHESCKACADACSECYAECKKIAA